VKDLEKSMKVSAGVYNLVKAYADQGDISIKDVATELVKAGLNQLTDLKDIVKHMEDDSEVQVQEVDGSVYYCPECKYPLDPEQKLDDCPRCQASLDWGGGMGVLGWGLIGLAMLLVVGSQRRTNQV